MTILIFAGFDTTANSIAWIMVEVAKQPHISEKIRDEIERVVGKGKKMNILQSKIYLRWYIMLFYINNSVEVYRL